MLEKITVIEQYPGCIAYDCGVVSYIRLEKGLSESDHVHEHEEIIFLMEGRVEAIIGEQKQIIDSPVKITIPANTYHKFTALTNVVGLELK